MTYWQVKILLKVVQNECNYMPNLRYKDVLINIVVTYFYIFNRREVF